MSRSVQIGTIGLALALAGCPQDTEVWIVEGSTASSLRFRVADGQFPDRTLSPPIRVDALRPATGEWELIWGAAPGPDGRAPLAEFQYGVLPLGYMPLIGQPWESPRLTPGCYEVSITGDGRQSFVVLPGDTIVVVGGCSLPGKAATLSM